MSGKKETKQEWTVTSIDKRSLPKYRDLILPYIYEELEGLTGGFAGNGYLCLAAVKGGSGRRKTALGTLIAQTEDTGDINIVSLFVDPAYRRQGVASDLLERTIGLARALYTWEEGETQTDVICKTLYRLEPSYEEVYRAFLEHSHFTEFVLLEAAGEEPDPTLPEEARTDGALDVWSAWCEISFFRDKQTGSTGTDR